MSMTPRHAPLGPSEERYYRHSGMVPLAGVSRAIVGGLAVGVVGAAVYAYLVRRIPFEYVRAALPVVLGALIGFVVARLGQGGKIRNRRATLVLVLLVTLVAYYFAGVFWIKLVLDGWAAQDRVSVGALIRSPGTLWAAIVRVDRTGTSTHDGDGDPVTGWFLRWAWLYEAAGIFGAAWVASSLMTAREMFCERCDRWVPRGTEIRRTAPG